MHDESKRVLRGAAVLILTWWAVLILLMVVAAVFAPGCVQGDLVLVKYEGRANVAATQPAGDEPSIADMITGGIK